jgi:hypothetical protein
MSGSTLHCFSVAHDTWCKSDTVQRGRHESLHDGLLSAIKQATESAAETPWMYVRATPSSLPLLHLPTSQVASMQSAWQAAQRPGPWTQRPWTPGNFPVTPPCHTWSCRGRVLTQNNALDPRFGRDFTLLCGQTVLLCRFGFLQFALVKLFDFTEIWNKYKILVIARQKLRDKPYAPRSTGVQQLDI